MKKQIACLIVGIALTFGLIVCCGSGQTIEADVLQSQAGVQWYRGNMHTHSHWSDGNDYLEMIAAWYRDADYQFLVFTDHNRLADTEYWVEIEKTKGGRKAFDKLKARYPDWVEERTQDGKLEVRLRRFDEVAEKFNQPEKFLVIQGEEISDRYLKYPIHLNVSNVQEVIVPRHGDSVYETIQNNVDAALAQRHLTGKPMIVHLNHPNFHFAVTAEDMMKLQGEKFFEVYNGHPGVHNHGDHVHASTERIWDIVLAQRLGVLGLPVMYGLANDDGHEYHNMPSRGSNPGRGWVMVLAKELTTPALIESLEAGRFYASSGVSFSQIESSSRSLSLDVDPVEGESYLIEFIGTRAGADLTGTPVLDEQGKPIHTTMTYSDDVGAVLKTVKGTHAEYRFAGDELYVRARVTSSAKHPNPSEVDDFKQGWTQPVIGPKAMAESTAAAQ